MSLIWFPGTGLIYKPVVIHMYLRLGLINVSRVLQTLVAIIFRTYKRRSPLHSACTSDSGRYYISRIIETGLIFGCFLFIISFFFGGARFFLPVVKLDSDL